MMVKGQRLPDKRVTGRPRRVQLFRQHARRHRRREIRLSFGQPWRHQVQ